MLGYDKYINVKIVRNVFLLYVCLNFFGLKHLKNAQKMKEPMPNNIGNIAMIIVCIAYKLIFVSP